MICDERSGTLRQWGAQPPEADRKLPGCRRGGNTRSGRRPNKPVSNYLTAERPSRAGR